MADDEPAMDYWFESSGLRLTAHLSEPPRSALDAPGLVLCHGFPVRGRESPASGKSFPQLADRIAVELGWCVLTINFRGCGGSEGDFSLQGWIDDIAGAVQHLRELGVKDVWLGGFGTGGALCVCQGARDPSVLGVAAMGAPADFEDWSRNPRRLLLHARQVGVVKDPAFPPSFDRWAAELKEISTVGAVGKLSSRPLLLLHGEKDELVPSLDARLLADEHGKAELRIISGAGHELRHDPRAVAVFLGWLARQSDAQLTR